MTHSDIYTKLMIEYDKANITSSYPSLTRYEVATILDKAYLALIAQKLTGNNTRRAGFESDIKALEDLRPLISNTTLKCTKSKDIENQYDYKLNPDFLYYISSLIQSYKDKLSIVKLVSHDDANAFKITDINFPWVKMPVAYVEEDKIKVLVDINVVNSTSNKDLYMTYIKKPSKFATGKGTSQSDYDFGETKFELSDTMAEELINLAIIMSTEIVESSRLSTKLNTRPLEA